MNRDTEVPDTPVWWAQVGCQAHQLGLDLVPLDGDSRPVAGNHRAVAHLRAVTVSVGRRQLDVTRRDQVLRDDHGLGIGGHGHVAIDLQGHLRLRALRLDRIDLADLDA